MWLGRSGMQALGALSLGLGLLLAFTGAFRLRNGYACRLPVQGVYCSCNVYVSKGVAQCAPVFEYTVNGRHIRAQSAEAMGRRRLEGRYREGERYRNICGRKTPAVVCAAAQGASAGCGPAGICAAVCGAGGVVLFCRLRGPARFLCPVQKAKKRILLDKPRFCFIMKYGNRKTALTGQTPHICMLFRERVQG